MDAKNLADDLRAEQSYLASSRDRCSEDDELPRWDRLQRVIDFLAALAHSDAGQAPIYQARFSHGWLDVDPMDYEDLAGEKRIVYADPVAPAAAAGDLLPNAMWTRHGAGSTEWWSFKGYEARKDSADQWVLRKAGEELYRHTYLQVIMAHAERAILEAAPAPAVAPTAAPSEWQPIETAPKTGRTLLLGYLNSAGKWRTVRGQWMSANYIEAHWEDPDDVEPGWFETSAEADDVPNCWSIEPTHWMPLPAAPQGAAQ